MKGQEKDNLPVYGLSYDEYTSIRNLYGMLGVADTAVGRLEKRLRIIPGGWRDARMLLSVLQKVLSRIIQTCPADRRIALAKELGHVHMEVKTTKPKKHEGMTGQITYVNQGPLERVIDKAVQMDCWGCRKSGRQVCDCQLRKDVQELYHYEFPQDWDNGCPLADRLDKDSV